MNPLWIVNFQSIESKDTTKDKVKPAESMKYRGLIGTTRTVISEEGAGALWNGLTAGLHR